MPLIRACARLDAAFDHAVSRGLAVTLFGLAVLGWAWVLA